jgi:transcriptional regulator with XRE-family HTH domain
LESSFVDTSDISVVFRNNLLVLMRNRGLTAASLSRKAGLNVRAVTDIFDGKAQSPRLSTVFKLAYALDVTVYELLDVERKTVDSDPNPRRNSVLPEIEEFLSSLDPADQAALLESLRKIAAVCNQD